MSMWYRPWVLALGSRGRQTSELWESQGYPVSKHKHKQKDRLLLCVAEFMLCTPCKEGLCRKWRVLIALQLELQVCGTHPIEMWSALKQKLMLPTAEPSFLPHKAYSGHSALSIQISTCFGQVLSGPHTLQNKEHIYEDAVEEVSLMPFPSLEQARQTMFTTIYLATIGPRWSYLPWMNVQLPTGTQNRLPTELALWHNLAERKDGFSRGFPIYASAEY